MKLKITIFFVMVLCLSVLVSAMEPMNLRTIKEIKSVDPADVANLGIGVYQISAQYNLGAYQGEWMGSENRRCEDMKFGAVWIEFLWERPETDVILIDGAGNERKIYLPASTPKGGSSYGEYYWIAEDGSSYYANSNHGHGQADLSYEQALVPEHLARRSLVEQKNPSEEEPLECGVKSGVTLRGQLVDQMTGKPISGAKLHSAYEFSPSTVMTDSDGNFEFVVSSKFTGSYTFYADCYGWSGNIAVQKDYEMWGSGRLERTYSFALRKEKFDAGEDVSDISGKSEVDIGKVYAWPSADISIKSDIDASFNVMYKYKNSEGYNGGGQGGYTEEHYLTTALPLGYDVFIQFEDASGVEYKSSIFNIPSGAQCGVVSLSYINGESKWSTLSEVEPTENSGPIEIDIPVENPDVVSRLCLGCFKAGVCYPIGYRESGKYCSVGKTFVSQRDSLCDNNFECSSNVCVSGECVSESLIQKILSWFRGLFG